MYKIVIIRDEFFGRDASLGTCLVYNHDGKQVFKKESLERGWRNNENRVSCIPVGNYSVILEYSPKFRKDLWEIKDVPNRSECKFHVSNHWHQLNGCIALGNARKYIDRDLVLDITSSRLTMAEFHRVLEGEIIASLFIFDVLSLTKKSI